MSDATVTASGPRNVRIIAFSGSPNDWRAWKPKFIALLSIERQDIITKIIDVAGTPTRTNAELNEALYQRLVMSAEMAAFDVVIAHEATKNGKAAWDGLIDKYEGNTEGRLLHLFMQLSNIRIKDNEDPYAYILRAEALQRQLKGFDEEVSDTLLKAVILNGLDKSYNTVITVIQAMRNVHKGILRETLQTHYKSLHPTDGSSAAAPDAAVAYAAQQPLRCRFCKQHGHEQRTCPKRTRAGLGATGKWCELHLSSGHNTLDCTRIQELLQQQQSAIKERDAEQANFALAQNLMPAINF